MSTRSTDATLKALVAVMTLTLVLMGAQMWRIYRQGEPSTPLTISACAPADFAADESCDGDPPVDPDELELTEDLRIPVAGRVVLDSDVDIAYMIEVAWESVGSEVRFPVIDVPVTYEAHRDVSYGLEEPFAWAVPPQMLAMTEGVDAGESLGLWRIVGRATPELERYAVYSWDSVKTFELIAPHR